MPKKKISRKDAPGDFLELFFPIHYTIGMTIENTLRNGKLTHQQTIILWLIRSKGENGQVMRRKDIVKSMDQWFELTNSAISKSLRALAAPPLELISIREDERSAREKVVSITPQGLVFLEEMIDNAKNLISMITDNLGVDEISDGINFMSRISDIFDNEIEQERNSSMTSMSKPSMKRQ